MATKYTARLEGKIVGNRTTASRKYTHAVVVQLSEEVARAKAYGYSADKSDSSAFEYLSVIAQGRSPYDFNRTEEAIAKALVKVDGGFDAYMRRTIDSKIASFEQEKADGKFEPGVATWCGRRDLAQKAQAQLAGKPWVAQTWIVEAEEVINAKRKEA